MRANRLPQTAAPSHSSAGSSIRRRLLRHYLPLAIASTLGLTLLMSASFFDANRYPPPGDIFAEGAKGALPSGDYPPQGRADPNQHEGRPSGQQHGEGTPTTISDDPVGGHTGPPAGGHATSETEVSTTISDEPVGGHTGPPAGGHATNETAVSTTQPDAEPAAAPTADEEHANDDSILRMRRLSTVTGYIALVLLAVTLLVGPTNLMLRRRTPVSSYLRRDIGIWTAFTSVVHVVFGFLVKHGDGQLLGYFFQAGDRTRILTNSFGLANWTGLAAVVLVAGLAVISSDAALRKLRARRWKRLQRYSYVLFALVVMHSVLYGALWRRTSPYTVLLGCTLLVVVIGQAVGIRLWRRRGSHTPTPT